MLEDANSQVAEPPYPHIDVDASLKPFRRYRVPQGTRLLCAYYKRRGNFTYTLYWCDESAPIASNISYDELEIEIKKLNANQVDPVPQGPGYLEKVLAKQ